MISEFLFYDEDSSKEEKTNYVNLKIEIRELLNDDFNRKILIDILMDLRKDLSGATLQKLFELYESLGLHNDSYKKLESWRWHTISKGILELTQMQVEESYGFVTKFINHKRSTIRKQAEMAIITLNDEGLNYFLDTTTYRISEWQQLKILEVLKNKSDFQPPSFQHWLISKNKDVVLFALRLMGHYNQSDGNQALIELLKHKKSEINAAAISCIKEFYVVEAVDTLKLVFWNSTVDIKINILDALASLGSTNDIEFLESIAAKESNFSVKSKASASINAIVPLSVMPTLDIQSDDKFEVPDDIPIEAVEENDEEMASADSEKESLKEFDANTGKFPLEAIDEKVDDDLVDDNEIEENYEVGETIPMETFEEKDEQIFSPNLEEEPLKTSETEKTDTSFDFIEGKADDYQLDAEYEIEEEILKKPLEEIEVDVSTHLEDENAQELEEEIIFQESLEMDLTESTNEKIVEKEIHSKSTFTMDFLPHVTDEIKAIVPYEYKKEKELISKDLFNIEIIYEILEHSPAPRTESHEVQEKRAIEEKKNFSLKPYKIDFLPIVKDEVKKEVLYKFEKKEGDKINRAELLEIETIFEILEQIDSTAINNEQEHEEIPVQTKIDFSEKSSILDFLPIVIALEKEIDKSEFTNDDKLIDLLEIPVIYSEIKIKAPEPLANKILSELNELVPLPAQVIPENKTQQRKNTLQEQIEPKSINAIDMKKIRKIECRGVEIKTDSQENGQEEKHEVESVVYDDFDEETKSREQNTLDWILAENEAKGELRQKIKTIVNQQKVSAIKLPKPIFYTEQEANIVALLDDIEALGDEREVPLLHDLLLDKDTLSLHERIHYLIEKISNTSVLKREPIIDNNKEDFSVFEEFFKTADSESKLILLDEIVALGDEKEVGFLKRLIESSSDKVQEKAKICLEGLIAKLALEGKGEQFESSTKTEQLPQSDVVIRKNEIVPMLKTNEISAEKPFSVFDIDFEVDFDKEH